MISALKITLESAHSVVFFFTFFLNHEYLRILMLYVSVSPR